MQPPGLSGTVFLADASNQASMKSDQITLISCDDSEGYLDAFDVLDSAASKSVQGALFYSETADYCNLDGYSNDYQWIYSMKSRDDTKNMLDAVQTSDQKEIYATVGYPVLYG